MKKVICIAVLMLAFNAASVMGIDAMGSAFGTLSTAKSLGAGVGNAGLVVGIADATTFAGTFTYGMSQYIDGRFKLGMISANDNTEVIFGADFKYQMWAMNDASAKRFDMGIGGMFEYFSSGPVSVLLFGGFVLGSYPVQLSNGKILTPYGRLNIRLESYSVDGGGSDSEIEFGLNAGVSYDLSDNITAFGEFQLDGNDGLFVGVDFRVL